MVPAPRCALLAVRQGVGDRENLDPPRPRSNPTPGLGDIRPTQSGPGRRAPGRRPPNGLRARSAIRVLRGGGPAPLCAQARAARGSDSSSALGGRTRALQVRTPGAGRRAARPRPAKRVLGSAAAGRCSSRAPPAGCTDPGGGSGRLSARGSGRVRGSRARRARPPCCCWRRSGGWGGRRLGF